MSSISPLIRSSFKQIRSTQSANPFALPQRVKNAVSGDSLTLRNGKKPSFKGNPEEQSGFFYKGFLGPRLNVIGKSMQTMAWGAFTKHGWIPGCGLKGDMLLGGTAALATSFLPGVQFIFLPLAMGIGMAWRSPVALWKLGKGMYKPDSVILKKTH